MRQYGASTLKKGTVQYNHIAAEQWLIKGEDKNYDGSADKYYRFQYNANEKNVSYLQPLVQILLHTSSRVVEDYTDDQMVEIWDRVLKSFKIKPNTY